MNIADVMDDVADRLGAIDGLRVHAYWADRITPPAAVVAWPDEYVFDVTMGRGADRLTLPVYVLTGKVDARSARDLLAAYANGGAPAPSITFVGVGTGAASADSDSSVTLTPALPSEQINADDLLLCLASVRNTDTGTVDTPSGWTLLHSSNTNNLRLFGKVATGGGTDTAPDVTFTNGAVNATALAQVAAFRGTSTNLASVVTATNVQSFTAALNIPFASLTVPSLTDMGIRAAWRQDDWTSVATVSNFTRIGEVNSQLGSDAGMLWDYRTNSTGWAGGTYVVTGGSGQSRAISLALAAGDPVPNRSVKNVLESGTYTAFDSLRVQGVEFQVVKVADVEYLGALFNVDIIGRGEA